MSKETIKKRLEILFEIIDGADIPVKEISEENKLKAQAAVTHIAANYKPTKK